MTLATELSQLQWSDSFVASLPGDPLTTNSTRQVRGAAYSRVEPTPVAAPTVLAASPEMAEELGLDPAAIASDDFAAAMGGNLTLDGMQSYAACYGGHQFGNWAGQLGDGRAITLGEVINPVGVRYELQLKGAGPTPYSRFADGRAVLRSSVREFLCSEAMHHLGVPTTRALSLVGTGDPVVRDMFYNGNQRAEQGAIVCRVARSFLRFGSFQIHTSRGDMDMLAKLLAYTFEHHFSHLGPVTKDSTLAFLSEVGQSTARLMAEWMRVGFVHGVMNTDNMSVLGLTIDYGPYGWIDNFDPDWTPNTTDFATRRYRFGLQPQMGGWNVVRLAEALYPIIDDMDAIKEAIGDFETAWARSHTSMVAGKLGLGTHQGQADDALWNDLTELLTRVETDMTVFFRCLADVSGEGVLTDAIMPAFYTSPTDETLAAWTGWLERYLERVSDTPRDQRRSRMNAFNPWFVLRNYLAQEAIEAAEQGDLSRVELLLDAARRPYDVDPDRPELGGKRPDWARDKPGCSTLSCSS
jgi:uncharacterized protein YdiU (UPF0061 family)